MHRLLISCIPLLLVACSGEPAQVNSSELTATVILKNRKVDAVYNPDGQYPVLHIDRQLYDLSGKQLTSGPHVDYVVADASRETITYIQKFSEEDRVEVKNITRQGHVTLVKSTPGLRPVGADYELEADYRYFTEQGTYGIGLIWRGDTVVPAGFHRIRAQKDGAGQLDRAFGWKMAKGIADSTYVFNADGQVTNGFAGYLMDRLPGGNWVFQSSESNPERNGRSATYGVLDSRGNVIAKARRGTDLVLPFSDDGGFVMVDLTGGTNDYVYDQAGKLLKTLDLVAVRQGFYVERLNEKLSAVTFSGGKRADFDGGYDLGDIARAATRKTYAVFIRGDATYVVDSTLSAARTIPGNRLTIGEVDDNFILLNDRSFLLNPNTGEEFILPFLAEQQRVRKIVYADGRPNQVVLSLKEEPLSPSVFVVIDVKTRARSPHFTKLTHLGKTVYQGKLTGQKQWQIVDIR